MKKILCIHGIGGKDAIMDQWAPQWQLALRESCGHGELACQFLKIDDLFSNSKQRLGKIKYLEAIRKFIASWVSTTIEERFRTRSFVGLIDWYAGMPAQFVTDEKLREELRARLKREVNSFQPDVIFAHSLGSLIAYDYLRQEHVANRSYEFVLVTAASQIGHPALRQLFGGALLPLPVRYWLNLRNENDRVFAARSIAIDSDNYFQVETPFNKFSINHEAIEYIQHSNAVTQAWPIAMSGHRVRAAALAAGALGVRSIQKQIKSRKPTRKALLIGINDYPNAEDRLEGCVNDVFRMSEVLQEFGFEPEEIRVTLNERATAKEIRKRLQWLLSDATAGDLRFFFFSGHGAQIPSSHDEFETDGNDECLVPYDFDWTIEQAYTDREFLELYSQLSREVIFISAFDCCHAGGLTRASGMKARGLNPPDDIRHREIKWDKQRQMWIGRDQKLASDKKYFKSQKDNPVLYTGANGRTNKLGRAFPLWTEIKTLENAKKRYGATGPYMPVILEACQENEYAYEYRHGVTSYGAFTYSLTTILREKVKKNKKVSFAELMAATTQQLAELEYKQRPVLVGPKIRTEGKLPFTLK